MDLTLQSLDRYLDAGQLGKSNADRRLPATELVAFGPAGSAHLAPGPYLATLNEVVHLPNEVMALGKPRSSLLRSGVAIHNAVWDAGYHGRSQVLMVVYNPHGFIVARDARILQLVFFTLEMPTATPYRGQFHQERL
jgi:dUTP pyrophosphatase